METTHLHTTPKMPLSSFCVGPLLLDCSLPFRGFAYPVRLLWRKRTFYKDSFQVRNVARKLMCTSSLRAITPYGTGRCRPCACCLNLLEFICVSVLPSYEGRVCLLSSVPSGSYTISATSSMEFS